MSRCGKAKTHCCWLGAGGKCAFVVPSDDTAHRWACSLRTRYGSWGEVHASPEYIDRVKPWMFSAGYQIDCGDWPPAGFVCNDCGEVGHG